MKHLLAGSHIPVLAQMALHTQGDVLEMGIGYNSTPLLHWICQAQNRFLLSLESDLEWVKMFKEYESDSHIIDSVISWDISFVKYMEGQYWDLVFIDHRPARQRHVDAINLKDNAKFIVIHDTEPENDKFYAYHRVWKHFKYVYHYDKCRPFTSVVSNFEDPRSIIHE